MYIEPKDKESASISIIVPVYNVELYLSDCLDSILSQNYNDYEVICINDASNDNSEKILHEYAKCYSQIKIVTHLKNRGLSVARNTGLEIARGKYILFIDSDDMIMPDTLVELHQVTMQNQVDIVYFDMVEMYHDTYIDGNDIDKKSSVNSEIYSGRELFCKFIENGQMKSEVCRQFIRREFLEEFGIRFYDGILHEDELFSFMCAMSAFKVTNLNVKYYIYRQRPGSIMSNRNHLRAESVFVILVQILAYWASHVFTDRENMAINDYYANLYNTYRYYSCFDEEKEYLEVGGFVEKALYTILRTTDINRYFTLNKGQLGHIETARHIIVFGAGRAAMDIVNLLKKNNVYIDVIAVSDTGNNPETFCGIRVDAIENIVHYINNALVIIAVTEKYRKGIQDRLEKLGYKDIVIPEQIRK